MPAWSRPFVFCLAVLASGWAQGNPATTAPPPSAPQESDIKIKAYTKLVEVPVIVTDGAGKHLTGLTKGDFRLYEGKVEKPIATFEYVTTSQSAIVPKSMPKGMYSNLLMGGTGPRAISIIVMDAINTPFMDQAYRRQQLIKYLKTQVQPNTLLALMLLTRSGVKVIHDYTTDSAVLIRALERVKTRGDSPTTEQSEVRATTGTDTFASAVEREAEALEDFVDTADQPYESLQRALAVMDTLAALEGISNSLEGIPGRKSLIWATGSFPLYFDDAKGFSSNDFSDRFAKLFQKLNDANIAIYPGRCPRPGEPWIPGPGDAVERCPGT